MTNKNIKEEKKKKSIFKETVITILYAVIAATIIRIYVFETMLVPTPSMVPTINIGDRLFIEKITYSAREPEIGEIVVFYTPFPDNSARQMLRAFDKFMDTFSPKEFQGSVKYVKRLVAKEGDVITLEEDSQGGYKLMVNGKVPEHLEGISYTKEGIFSNPKLWEYLYQASKLKVTDENEFQKYIFRIAVSEGYEFGRLVGSVATYIPYYQYVEKYLQPKDIKFSDYVWTEGGKIFVKIPKGFYFFMGDNSSESFDSRYFGFVPKHAVIGRTILRIWPVKDFGPVQPLIEK